MAMVRSLDCLVEKHKGRDPYFRTAVEPPRDSIAIKRGVWPVGKLRANRAVDNLHQRTHEDPSPLGDLNRIYPNAIELGRIGLRPIIAIGFALFFFGLAAFVVFVLRFLVTESVPVGAIIMVCVFFIPLFVFSLFAAWWCCRIAVWGPHDEPVLFNRATRQVHALKPVLPDPVKFWQLRGKSRLITHPWDRVHVRSYVSLAAGGGGATTKSSLFLLWDTPEAPRTLVDYVQLGSRGGWVDDPHYRQWEYIRRYMEEDGPILPTDNTLNSSYNKRPNMFSPTIVEAAGGTPYTPEEIEARVNEYKAAEQAAKWPNRPEPLQD